VYAFQPIITVNGHPYHTVFNVSIFFNVKPLENGTRAVGLLTVADE